MKRMQVKGAAMLQKNTWPYIATLGTFPEQYMIFCYHSPSVLDLSWNTLEEKLILECL